MKINTLLIEQCSDNGELNHLSVFVYLKGIYTNSCIYNYTQEGMIKKSKLSRAKIRNHIPFFLKEGWAFFDGNNLILAKISSIDKNNKKKILVDLNTRKQGIKPIYDKLLYELLKLKANQAKWYSKLCHDLKKMSKTQRLRVEKRVAKKRPRFSVKNWNFGESGSHTFKVSFRKLAIWFNCSIGKAHKIMKELCVTGWIEVLHTRALIAMEDSSVGRYRIEENNKLFYTTNNQVCKTECNQYIFR